MPETTYLLLDDEKFIRGRKMFNTMLQIREANPAGNKMIVESIPPSVTDASWQYCEDTCIHERPSLMGAVKVMVKNKTRGAFLMVPWKRQS